jgi:hypothetical protein
VTEDEFKAVRYRFYKLGLKRRREIFVSLGLCNQNDDEFTKEEERAFLFLLLEKGRVPELLDLISKHEADIRAEKEVWNE